MVVAELKLRQIEREVLLAHMMISADDSTFQERPEGIEICGVNLPANVLAFVVIDRFVPKAFAAKSAVACILIGSYKLDPVADSFADESFKGSLWSCLR